MERMYATLNCLLIIGIQWSQLCRLVINILLYWLNIILTSVWFCVENNLSKSFRNNTELLLKSLPSDKENGNYREIPAFTKPLSSTLNWIFEYYPTLLTDEAKQILKHDFTQTDILYLTDKKKYVYYII